MTGRVLLGTCNWADHKNFYPPELDRTSRQRERLTYYAKFFPIVEIDSSWYGIPKPTNVQRWVDQTPDEFVMNIKAFRTLTGHGLPGDRRSRPTEQEERNFEEALKPLRESGKLRAIHYQFPPWMTSGVRSRDVLMAARDRHPDDLLAIEFRHRSWYEGDALAQTEELLRELDAVFVAVDAPQTGRGTAPPHASVTSRRLAIVRFHGRNTATWYRRTGSSADRFDHHYSRNELEEWVPAIRALQERAAEVHLLMNTNNGNQGPANAYRLADLLQIELPTPPERLAIDARC